MSDIGDVVSGIRDGISGLTSIERFSPEPRSRNGLDFGGILKNLGGAITDGVSTMGGIDPMYIDLINRQIEVQQQMQLVSFESNIEKSRHETQMAAIRNLRVG